MAMGTEQTTARIVIAIMSETVDSMAMGTEQTIVRMVSAILSETVDNMAMGNCVNYCKNDLSNTIRNS